MIVEGPQGPQGPQGPKVPEINKGPQSNLYYQDGPQKGQLRPSDIRSVEQSSQSVSSKTRAAEFARDFKTGEQPKIGSGYDPSRASRDAEQTLRGQREAQRNTAARAADFKTTARMAVGADKILGRAGKAAAFTTGAKLFAKAVNSKYFDPTRIDTPGGMKEEIKNRILNIIAEKLEALKEHLMLEANRNVIKQGRAKIIKARVRGGKIQRRKKLSAVKGYTIRGGKLVRMSPSEKRKRKMGARRGKLKRRAKMARALMKRKRSLRKRAAIGLK